MSIPYVVTEVIWDGKEATETKELKSEFEKCALVVIEVTMTGFSGTLDFKGKMHELAAYSNVPWIRQDQASAQTPSISQESETTTTAVRRYVICGWWRKLQIVMARSAGSITISAVGSSHGLLMPRIVVA